MSNRMTGNQEDDVGQVWDAYAHGIEPAGTDMAHADAIAESVFKGEDGDNRLESVPGVVHSHGKAVRRIPDASFKFYRRLREGSVG